MYNVSTAYKNAIYGTNRKNYARFLMDARSSAASSAVLTVTTNGEYVLSNVSGSLNNGQRQQEYQLVSTEVNRVKLDGTFRFCPDSPTAAQVNYVSSRISTTNGAFADNVVLTFTYASSFNTNGYSITFDTNSNEYAVDFIVDFYDSSNNLLYEKIVTNNQYSNVQIIQTLTGLKKVTLTISKWSLENRRARITEVDAGLVWFFTDNQIIRINFTEETARVMDNFVMPELTVTVQDPMRIFDPLNTDGAFNYLAERQYMTVDFGLDLGDSIEYVPLGKFYLNDWKNDYGTISATFRGFNILSNLDYVTYEQTTPQTGYTFNDAAIAILTAAGITNYSINADLSTYTTNGLISKRSAREALQMVAIGSGTLIYADRTGKVFIADQFDFPTVMNTINDSALFEFPVSNRTVSTKSVSINYYSSMTTIAGNFSYTSPTITSGQNLLVDGNTLINNLSQAVISIFTILDAKMYESIYDIRFRGNPALELWDRIEISTPYGYKRPHISKIELTYEGYITCRLLGSDLF